LTVKVTLGARGPVGHNTFPSISVARLGNVRTTQGKMGDIVKGGGGGGGGGGGRGGGGGGGDRRGGRTSAVNGLSGACQKVSSQRKKRWRPAKERRHSHCRALTPKTGFEEKNPVENCQGGGTGGYRRKKGPKKGMQ